MMRLEEIVGEVSLVTEIELRRWIELSWVRPSFEGETYFFSDIDVARVRMICDVRYACNVEEETMPLVLSLLDQLYATRRTVRQLTDAVAEQPDDIREAIFKLISEIGPS